jgi:succinylglutamate desuccinylase
MRGRSSRSPVPRARRPSRCGSASAALSTYAAGSERRRALAATMPGAKLDTDPAYGIGTTEYMRSIGGLGVTLECGQHDDPEAPEVAYRAIVRTLAHLGISDAPDPGPVPQMQSLRLCEVIDKTSAGDAFARTWRSFDPVAAGERIGTRGDGTPVVAPFAGMIVFPNSASETGQEWFYLARESERLRR